MNLELLQSEPTKVTGVRYYKDTVTYDTCHNSLPDHTLCWGKLVPAEHPVFDGEAQPAGLVCPRCGMLYLKRKAQTAPSQREVSFSGPDVTLYVGKSAADCRRHGHPLESVTGIFETVRGIRAKVNVNYCKSEEIYFMSTEDFLVCRDEYGILLGNIHLNILKAPGTYHDFSENAEMSPLRIYGYTVDQSIGLTASERHMVLKNILDFGLMYKSDVIGYLDYFLRINREREHREAACSKWAEDRRWVREYEIDQQRQVYIRDTRNYRR